MRWQRREARECRALAGARSHGPRPEVMLGPHWPQVPLRDRRERLARLVIELTDVAEVVNTRHARSLWCKRLAGALMGVSRAPNKLQDETASTTMLAKQCYAIVKTVNSVVPGWWLGGDEGLGGLDASARATSAVVVSEGGRGE